VGWSKFDPPPFRRGATASQRCSSPRISRYCFLPPGTPAPAANVFYPIDPAPQTRIVVIALCLFKRLFARNPARRRPPGETQAGSGGGGVLVDGLLLLLSSPLSLSLRVSLRYPLRRREGITAYRNSFRAVSVTGTCLPGGGDTARPAGFAATRTSAFII